MSILIIVQLAGIVAEKLLRGRSDYGFFSLFCVYGHLAGFLKGFSIS